jgi:hypothetical protein
MPSFPKHPHMPSTFRPIAHNTMLAQILCLDAIAGATVLCVQCPARMAVLGRVVEVRACGRCSAFGKNLGEANRACLVTEVTSLIKRKPTEAEKKVFSTY